VETRFVIIMGIKRLAYYLHEYRGSLVIALATNDTCRIAGLEVMTITKASIKPYFDSL